MKALFLFLQRIVPQHLLSRLVGLLAHSRVGIIKGPFIRLFIGAYNVDLSEAEIESPAEFLTFNAFFTRALKPGVRPVSGAICSPADGAVSMVGPIEVNHLLQAKGITYSLDRLLGEDTAAQFENGSFATIYLAPRDYHRVHSPMEGTLRRARYIPGKLFSVNQTTAGNIPDLFAINERLVLWFDTVLGPMCVVLVGAMIVAGIKSTWRERMYEPGKVTEETGLDIPFRQGEELGQFQLGSTVIVVLPRAEKFEVAPGDTVRMGQALVK